MSAIEPRKFAPGDKPPPTPVASTSKAAVPRPAAFEEDSEEEREAAKSSKSSAKGKASGAVKVKKDDYDMDLDYPESEAEAEGEAGSEKFSDEEDETDDEAGFDEEGRPRRRIKDPIEHRVPVYLNPHYLASLTLLQYPDRLPTNNARPLLPPVHEDYPAPSPIISARYKPVSQHLEITVPVENNPERWNADRALELGKGVIDEVAVAAAAARAASKKPKKNQPPPPPPQEKVLDRITYQSHAVPDATNYLVGVYTGHALHLNPVTQTYQLRAALTYLDNILSDERKAKTRAAKANADDSDESEEEAVKAKTTAKAVQVTVKQSADLSGGGAFGKGGGGGANGRADSTLFDPLRAKEGEAWIELEHFHADADQSQHALEHMSLSPKQQKVKLEGTTKPAEYLKC